MNEQREVSLGAPMNMLVILFAAVWFWVFLTIAGGTVTVRLDRVADALDRAYPKPVTVEQSK